jgi:Fe-S cluster assembly protein SufD
MKKVQEYHFTEDVKLVLLEVVDKKQIIEKLELLVEEMGIECEVIFKFILLSDVSLDIDLTAIIPKGKKLSKMIVSVEVVKVDESSKVRLKPNMEIRENEVEASHGLSIGGIDSDQINYLTSRGISKKLAKLEILKGMIDSTQGVSMSRKNDAIKTIEQYFNNAN